MARIPLQNGGALPNAPQGARVPLAQNLPIGQTPIPRQGEQWAQALGQASEAFQVMARKTAEANDTRQLIEAEGDMRRHAMEFQQFQQTTTDQEQWLPEWQKRQTEMQKRMDSMKLTDGARLRLTSSFGRWSDSNAIAIQGEAFKQAVGRSLDAVKLRAAEGAKAGDYGQIDNALSLAVEGSMTPEQKELERARLYEIAKNANREREKMMADTIVKEKGFAGVSEANAIFAESPHWTPEEKANMKAETARAVEVENLAVIANDDPRRALELAPAFEQAGKITAPERIRIMDAAEGRLNEVRTEKIQRYSSQIQNGVPDINKLAAQIYDDADLEVSDKEGLQSFIKMGPINDPVSYAKLFSEAKGFEKAEGTPEYAQFVSRVGMALKGPEKESVMATLGETVKAPKDASTRAFNEVFAMGADDLKNGLFGDYLGKLQDPSTLPPPNVRQEIRTLRDQLIADEGEGEMKTIKENPRRLEFWERRAREKWHENNADKNKGDFMSYAIEDENKKREASKRWQDSLANLEKWRRENPKATPQEFRAEYEKSLVRQRAVGSVGTLLPSTESIQQEINVSVEEARRIINFKN
jgi:hypothetical protein